MEGPFVKVFNCTSGEMETITLDEAREKNIPVDLNSVFYHFSIIRPSFGDLEGFYVTIYEDEIKDNLEQVPENK
jgi:hypothetical protein